jgi:ATP-dependent helicase/DNAse subunit B
VLGLEEEEDEAELGDFSASLRGKIYHAVLERYYKAQGALTLGQASDEVFAEHHWQDVGLYPVVWKSVKARMEEQLASFIQWDAERIAATGLAPAWFEKDLQGKINLPTLPEALKGLSFHGRTDRVDLDSKTHRFQVVDYKTRWSKSRGSVGKNVISGRMHQPAIYAELALAELGRWALEGAGVYVIEGDKETDRLQAYAAADWARDRKRVLEGISAYIQMIAAGQFPINPVDDPMGYCHWCSFSSICRKSHRRSRDRAEAELNESVYQKIHERRPPRA